jgi:hypothetical protein
LVWFGSELDNALLTGSTPLLAAGPVSDVPGTWIPTRVDVKGNGAVAKSWERRLREIEADIKLDAAFLDIRGYYPHLLLQAEPPVGGRGPWVGYVAFEAWWPYAIEQVSNGAPKVKAKYEFNRPEGLWIGINTLGELSRWVGWVDEGGASTCSPGRGARSPAFRSWAIGCSSCARGRHSSSSPSLWRGVAMGDR